MRVMWAVALTWVGVGCTEYGLGDEPKADPGTTTTSTTETTTGGPGQPNDPPDSDDPTDPVDPTDPTDPANPTDPDPNWVPELDPDDPGLYGGHFDVDTASEIAEIGNGDTDGHVHEYDDAYNVVGVDYFDILDGDLHPIDEDITDRTQRFKLIVANGDLSPGARIVINDTYNGSDPASYTPAAVYDNTALGALPIYTLDAVAGADHLEQLGIYFDVEAILDGDLIGTETGCVRDNELGAYGSWRNGAVTLQAVAVNADGSDAFGTDTTLSYGGVQGVATSGLLWETTIFWHWDGPCSHDPDWATHVPDFDE